MLNNTQNYIDFFNLLELLLFVLDTNGNILYCNDTALKRLGYAREELIGKPVVTIHPPDQRILAAEIINKMLAGKTKICPIPVITKDGTLIQVETKVTRGMWNNAPALFGVTKDITDIKLSNDKFTAIFQFSPIPIAITGIADGKIYEVNNAWIALTGYTLDDIKDKTIYDLELYRDKKERESLILKLEHDGILYNYPIVMKVKNAKLIIGEFSAAAITINNVKCWITSMVDRTNQAKLEKAITTFKFDMLNKNII